MCDRKRFNGICDSYNDNLKERSSIGVLKEKTLHAILKLYMEDDAKRFQEQKVGSYVADLFNGEEICEIQTANLGKLRKKLEFFLERYPVTVVHPIPAEKYLIWVDPESGEISKPRKSPVRMSFSHVSRELYPIRDMLSHPNLHFKFILLKVHDYKIRDGYGSSRKNRAHRYERFPVELLGETDVDVPTDYFKLFPRLDGEFTVNEYQKHVKLDSSYARMALNIMISLGFAEICGRSGKSGKKYVYRFKSPDGEQD